MSIVGVLVAGGLMGGLALFLANLNKQQHISAKRAETRLELNALHGRILGVLSDGKACTVSVGPGSSVPVAGSNQTRPLTALKNRAGSVVIGVGEKINRLLEVESITLKNVTGNVGTTREAKIEVVIKKLGLANRGTGSAVKTFPITVELASLPATFASCHSTLDAVALEIKRSMCLALGGTWQAGICNLDSMKQQLKKQICEELGGTAAFDSVTRNCNNVIQPLRSDIDDHVNNHPSDVTCPNGYATFTDQLKDECLQRTKDSFQTNCPGTTMGDYNIGANRYSSQFYNLYVLTKHHNFESCLKCLTRSYRMATRGGAYLNNYYIPGHVWCWGQASTKCSRDAYGRLTGCDAGSGGLLYPPSLVTGKPEWDPPP